MRMVQRFLVLSVLLALCLPWAPSTFAQADPWSAPFEVSDSQKTPSSWFPDIAVDPEGNPHIIWSSGIKDESNLGEAKIRDLLMYRALQNGEWTPVNDIDMTGEGGYTVRNSIALGRDGRLHVLVRRHLTTYYMSAPWKDAWSAQAWTEPRAINGASSYFNAIVSDGDGRLHIIWTEAIPDEKGVKPTCSQCSDVFYRQSDDNGATWSRPINLSQTPDGSTKPQIKVDKNNGVHVLWEEGFDWYASAGEPKSAIYRYSPDGGVTWQAPVVMTLPNIIPKAQETYPGMPPEPTPAPIPQAPQQVTLGLYQDTLPVIVYRSNVTEQVYYQYMRESDKTWTEAAAIPNIIARDYNDGFQDAYTMATDGSGRVHLILAGYRPGETDSSLDYKPTDQRNRPRLFQLVWDGQKWSEPEVLFTEEDYPGFSAAAVAACDVIAPSRLETPRTLTKEQTATFAECRKGFRYPEWPRVVISGDRLYLTWFTRNGNDIHDSEKGAYQVWYSSRQIDGTSLVAIPQLQYTPTPVVQPSPTPEPTVIPTATPLPAASLESPVLTQRVAWEAPGMVLIGIAVGIVTILLGIWIGAVLLIRRRRHSSQRRY